MSEDQPRLFFSPITFESTFNANYARHLSHKAAFGNIGSLFREIEAKANLAESSLMRRQLAVDHEWNKPLGSIAVAFLRERGFQLEGDEWWVIRWDIDPMHSEVQATCSLYFISKQINVGPKEEIKMERSDDYLQEDDFLQFSG